MKTLTIRAKMSGTGTIHDFASEHYDRDLNFRGGTGYAVLLPAYYTTRVWMHKYDDTSIRTYNRLAREGYDNILLVDQDGVTYTVEDMRGGDDDAHNWQLVKTGKADFITVKEEVS